MSLLTVAGTYDTYARVFEELLDEFVHVDRRISGIKIGVFAIDIFAID